MHYQDYISSFSQDEYCPFCHFTKEEIVAETKYFNIVLARAPYQKDHILIVPKRHIIFLKELKKIERKQLWELADERNQKLQKQYQGTTILIRDTLSNNGTGKSINHLHLHIVPERYIGIIRDDDREFFSEEGYIKETERMRKKYL
jgi:diadenosine tetraphosphate (Ap4A) HIT family hydrolase